MKDINKILFTLSLAASDTREDTIKSIIRTTLKETTVPITVEELIQNINIVYDIELHNIEFNNVFRILQSDGEVEVVSNSLYVLASTERQKLVESEAQLVSNEVIRYQNFKNFIHERAANEIREADCKLLWKNLKNYFYGCFYHYGIQALEMLHPKYTNNIDLAKLNVAELLIEASKDLRKPELISAFKTVVNYFPDFATKEDLDFIDEIGQKTLAFASLGLSEEDIREQIDINLVNWTLYLDTNFLFSILDLHSNVENEASKELLKLITANRNIINIQFRYTELTLQELRRKKTDFKSLDHTLTTSAINAILKSEDLDDFARQFYNKLLVDRKNTIHPSKVIDLAEITLPSMNVQIARKQKQVNALGDDYIGEKINDYQRYITQKNQTRAEKSKSKSTSVRLHYRSESQLVHDITLRELILSSRTQLKKSEAKTFNDVKYFGVTLDELLIKFDQYENGKKVTTTYPTFFKPSFLLNKLVRLLPVKTDNYKKAFIKAVSSRGYYKEPDKSNDIIKVASYLKSMGIDNEEILLNLICEKLFMEKFHSESQKQDFNSDVFFEAEINHIISEKHRELQVSRGEISKLSAQQVRDTEEKINLNSNVTQREEEVRVLSRAVTQLRKQLKSLEKSKPTLGNLQLDLESEKENIEITHLKKQLSEQRAQFLLLENDKRKALRNKFITKRVFLWRLRTFSYILVSVLSAITIMLYLNYFVRQPDENLSDMIDKYRENVVISGILSIASLSFSGFFIKRFSDQFSMSNVNGFKANAEKEMSSDLKDLTE